MLGDYDDDNDDDNNYDYDYDDDEIYQCNDKLTTMDFQG